MKLLILAAGEGKRLKPLTDDMPKCMVKYNDKPIIDYILDATTSIENKNIVCGFKCSVLKEHLIKKNIKFFNNDDYENTNMVYSMLKAKEIFNDDLIVSYSDIVYPQEFIETLLEDVSEVAVVADKNWHLLWKKRFDNVLDDCETFKYDKYFNLYEIGKKSSSVKDTMAGYVGLIKFSHKVLSFIETMQLDKKMYMTDLLAILCKKFKVRAVIVDKHWIEIDNINDLNININNTKD